MCACTTRMHTYAHRHACTNTHSHKQTNKQTNSHKQTNTHTYTSANHPLSNKQTNKLTQTNKHTHIHKCKPPTLHSAWYTHTCTSTIRACWSLIHLICNFDFFSAPVWLPLMYPWPPLDAHVPSPTLDAHVP